MKRRQILTTFALGLGLVMGLLWLLDGGMRKTTRAQGPDGYEVYHVAPGGDCGGMMPCYGSVQAAVDAVDDADDVVKVAAGTYTGVSARSGITQVVYISKTVTVRGGYTTTNWSTSNPISYPTTLDAQKQGRVLYVAGDVSVTVEGLRITGGNASGLGGVPEVNRGGGMLVVTATVIMSNNQVLSNTANHGGGVCFYNSADAALTGNIISNNWGWYRAGGGYFYHSPTATLTANTIGNNTANYAGPWRKHCGGAAFDYSDNAVLIGNTISGNRAANTGGGLCFDHSDGVTLTDNFIIGNVRGPGWDGFGAGVSFKNSRNASLFGNMISGNTGQLDNLGTILGGGLHIGDYSTATLNSNTISANGATRGGGLSIANSTVTLVSDIITGNTVYDSQGIWEHHHVGGGVYLNNSTVTMTNVVIADNRTETEGGGGLYIEGSSPRLLHTTIARNGGGDGSGVYITGTLLSPVTLTNTILVSHSVGITVAEGSAAVLDTVLWYSNTANTGGGGSITVTREYTGDPAFADDGYHLTASSEAIDRGVYAGVDDDVDGDPRPVHAGHDIGADEFTDPLPEEDSPTLQLLAFQPWEDGYLFTARLDNAQVRTQYVISAYHHTDIDYPQGVVTVTTDGSGVASAKVWSRCAHQNVLTGHVFARLEQNGVFQVESNQLSCPSLRSIADFGSHSTTDPTNDDWIYRPSPPGPGSIRIEVCDGDGRSGLTGTIRIRSADAGYELPEQPLVDEGGGLYSYTWSISGLPRAGDYRVQLTLQDGGDGLGGVDAFVKLGGRAMWVWGEAEGGENPAIWAMLTNEDHDEDGVGDREEWLAFGNAPYGSLDPYATTTYLSVYPYISYSGTLVTDTFQSFLTTAHITGEVRVEALAGTYEWVESDDSLQDGKDLCDAILSFNRAGATPTQRFDGIHYDVEHDDWSTDDRWDRFMALITYCQGQVDLYNQTHQPIVFGVDIPPHFLTGAGSSGQVKSNWDVMSIVDSITLMDYRDFADERWDGRTDGIIPRAEAFMVDGNALGKLVFIGVELNDNPYDHVTFFEECPDFMENELREVSRHFAGEYAYRGIAIHDYRMWKGKECVFLPLILRNSG